MFESCRQDCTSVLRIALFLYISLNIAGMGVYLYYVEGDAAIFVYISLNISGKVVLLVLRGLRDVY